MSQYPRRCTMLWPLCVLMLLASVSHHVYAQTAALKLALDWYPNANHLGLFIAQEKGYFRQENLNVTLYTPVDPSTVLQTVGSSTDDFGISYQPDVLLARAQRVPVVSVAGLVPHPLNSVMALKSSGITRPRDLVGKKVGYPAIPTNEPLLGTMLKTDGARGLQDVELVGRDELELVRIERPADAGERRRDRERERLVAGKVDPHALRRDLGIADRDDIATIPDLIDFDEGRFPSATKPS